MRCQQLLNLLNSADLVDTQDENTERIAAHLRTCPRCQPGIVRLSQALIANDMLSCEQCRDLLPTFYEATRPDYPLVKMPEHELKAVLIHLSHCIECQDDYRFLTEVAEMEEADLEEAEGEDFPLP